MDKFAVLSQEMKCFTQVVVILVVINIFGSSYSTGQFRYKLQIYLTCFEHLFT